MCQPAPDGAAFRLLTTATLVFWDFDGVIKDSVQVKGEAFHELFAPFGGDLAARVLAHHEAHTGVSRFEKIPLYLQWADLTPDAPLVAAYCVRLGTLVKQRVIASRWVPGVEPYLRANADRQAFVLISATPQDELEEIVDALDLGACFSAIYGAPTPKADVVRRELQVRGVEPASAVVVGDSASDANAAMASGVPFLLRPTGYNEALQRQGHTVLSLDPGPA
ncbi:MAG: HAD family hydrolase [Acidimicrobiia bacterium]|nr:HAD family hydrolase [Acidimicrobiia bacterium]